MSRRERRSDGVDGVRVTRRARRPRLLGPVLFVAAVVLGVGWWRGGRDAGSSDAVVEARRSDARAPAPGPAPGPGPGPVATTREARPATPGARTMPAATVDGEDPTPDLADYVLPGEAPTMGQVIGALHARGIRTGLGAFNPPGTRPPLEGLEVPEGFVLPEGYVRHHQATDDGQRIPPILMFSPDLQSVVVRGVRVPVPPDRVVPPELAPPGMPLRRVVIPPVRDGGGR